MSIKLKVRRQFTLVQDKFEEFGRATKIPLRKVAVVAIVENVMAGRYAENLRTMIEASVGLGEVMAKQAVAAMDGLPVQSYGKGGVVGIAGEQEHANALLTTAFAEPFRAAIGGGKAWISSMTKVAAPGAIIDVPLNHIGEVYVRSHYDGMTIHLPDGPLPDEIAIIFCLANRGRLNARVGGLTHEEVTALQHNANERSEPRT